MATFLPRAFLLCVIAAPVACGGSSSGGGDPPDVAGRYSFETGRFELACSDGSAGSNAGINLVFLIEQDGDRIFVANQGSGPPAPGITIVRNSGLRGDVGSNGSFELEQETAANIQGIPGTVQLVYEIAGRFTNKGWRGDYTYRFQVGGATCIFEAPFSGKKLKQRPSASNIEENIREEYPLDIYDRFGVAASRLGAD